MAASNVSLRAPMLPLARSPRAYFAPVARVNSGPAVFDPALSGSFNLDSPPAPWVDLGWIENLKRAPGTRIEPLRAGSKGAPGAQFRAQLQASIEFDFREWGKLQMALAGGSQHLNLLASSGASPAPSGGTPVAAITLQPGSSATQLALDSASLATFLAGDLVAVDLDYTGQTGYLGAGIAGAYVKSAADVASDPNYIRRVTFNVGRVSQKTSTSLLLAQPLPGGAPSATAKVQKILGFVDREGGSFFQEWSALFVLPLESGARICFYYPLLQPAAPAHESSIAVASIFTSAALHAAFTALPYTDPNDNEQVLCYRSYLPASSAAVY